MTVTDLNLFEPQGKLKFGVPQLPLWWQTFLGNRVVQPKIEIIIRLALFGTLGDAQVPNQIS